MRGAGEAARGAAPGQGGSGGRLQSFYATCSPGLEAVVAAELASPAIGAVDVQPGRAGVTFRGTLQTGALSLHALPSKQRLTRLPERA